MSIIITSHSIKRAKQRCGIKKNSVEQQAERAYNEGLNRIDCVGNLRKWLDYISDQEGKHSTHDNNVNKFMIYGSYVWLFDNNVLVTVIDIPSHLMNSANAQRKRKEGGIIT